MKLKTINLIAIFLSSITISNVYADEANTNQNKNLIIQPTKNGQDIPFNFINYLYNFNNRNLNNKVNIDNVSKELIELSHDDYFLDQASRVNSELQIVLNNAKLNKNKVNKKSQDYYTLQTDSVTLQKYISEKYPNAYHSFEEISKDKASVAYLKKLSPSKLIMGSPAVSTNVYANVEAAANAVAVSNVAAATNVAVAAEVFVVVAAIVI